MASPAAVRSDPAEGTRLRVLEGDFSHLPEHDRPPRVVAELIAVTKGLHHDKSDTRPPIPQAYPGKPITALRGRHAGAVAILCNGPSLLHHDLRQIRVPIIGLNRTFTGHPAYHGPEPDYLCVVDDAWLSNPHVRDHPGLINGSQHPRPLGYRATKSHRMGPFSFDLSRDGYVSLRPCSTCHLALQVAVWMGFTRLYMLGWDLGGAHFDGTAASDAMGFAAAHHQQQAPLLRERGIDVFVCGSPQSRAIGFEHRPFEALLQEAA